MESLLPWVALLAVLLGNGGFWVFWFNRVNAMGLPRKLTKRLEKLIVFLCFAVPATMLGLNLPGVLSWLGGSNWFPAEGFLLRWWSAWNIACTVVLGPMWLESRRWLMVKPNQLLKEETELIHVGCAIDGGSAGNPLTRKLNQLPGNQISFCDFSTKDLQLNRSVDSLSNLRIGHLSDIHFTGQFRFQHYEFVIEKFCQWKPDLVVLTGDIIDKDKYCEWIEPLFSRIQAPAGKFFLLGNHDARVKHLDLVLKALDGAGFIDVGVENRLTQFGATQIELIGNELPWFERHTKSDQEPYSGLQLDEPGEDVLRIGLSHSPDQIGWARRQHCDVMFAGHTHGGHARFPLIGPVLSPSMYGSRFASGVFYWSPTLMHVSRGVAGTHALRWWCPPEVSLVTLENVAGAKLPENGTLDSESEDSSDPVAVMS